MGCATAFTITAGLMGFGRLLFAHEERDDMLESFILTASITCCLVASVGIHNLAYAEEAIVLFQFWPAIYEKLHSESLKPVSVCELLFTFSTNCNRHADDDQRGADGRHIVRCGHHHVAL